MPITLLIDNNIVLRLVSFSNVSNYLIRLCRLIEEKYIVLLCPEVLLEEWNKHRPAKIKAIAASLDPLRTDLAKKKAVNNGTADFTEEEIEELSDQLNSQIPLIDNLLKNLAVKIARQDDIDLQISNHRRLGKAPFRLKTKDNFNDAELLFYSKQYLVEHNGSEIFFVSDNTAEFAISQKQNRSLHPDISDLFSPAVVRYFTDLKDAFLAFDQLGFPHVESSADSAKKIKKEIDLNTSAPMLDQIHEYLTKRFALLNFIPKEILIEHYPFSKDHTFKYLHKPFTLVTDHPEVYSVLSSIKVEESKVTADELNVIKSKDDSLKIIEIFKYLFRNQIYFVGFKLEKEKPLQLYEDHKNCECVNCLVHNLKYESLLNKLGNPQHETEPDILQQNMHDAYACYKTGDFLKAAEILENLLHQRAGTKDVYQYIINFNLRHLGSLINYNYLDDNDTQLRAAKLMKIDLDQHYKLNRTKENNTILRWIHEKKFYHVSLLKMHQSADSVEDIFHRQSTGGNTYLLDLKEEFESVESLLDKNFIMYDIFSEYRELAAVYIEGLIASYRSEDRLGGKLLHFNNDLLVRMALKGKSDQLRALLVRYKVRSLKYVAGPSELRFPELLSNMLDSYAKTRAAYNLAIDQKNEVFWTQYSEIIYFSISILGVLEVSDEELNNFVAKLLPFLRQENHLNPYYLLKSLQWLFVRIDKRIKIDLLKEFINLSILENDYHNAQWIRTLSEIAKRRALSITFSEIEFSAVLTHFLGKCPACEKDHSPNCIVDLFAIMSDRDQKQIVRNRIEETLTAAFDSSIYYLSSVCDVIDRNHEFEIEYENSIKNRIQSGRRLRHPFANSDTYNDQQIDCYLNYCFKFNIEISKETINLISELDPYYKWLLSLDSFDYSKFNAEWLDIYFTIYYKEKFKKSEVLKNHLLKMIKNDPYFDETRKFIDIYCVGDDQIR